MTSLWPSRGLALKVVLGICPIKNNPGNYFCKNPCYNKSMANHHILLKLKVKGEKNTLINVISTHIRTYSSTPGLLNYLSVCKLLGGQYNTCLPFPAIRHVCLKISDRLLSWTFIIEHRKSMISIYAHSSAYRIQIIQFACRNCISNIFLYWTGDS